MLCLSSESGANEFSLLTVTGHDYNMYGGSLIDDDHEHLWCTHHNTHRVTTERCGLSNQVQRLKWGNIPIRRENLMAQLLPIRLFGIVHPSSCCLKKRARCPRLVLCSVTQRLDDMCNHVYLQTPLLLMDDTMAFKQYPVEHTNHRKQVSGAECIVLSPEPSACSCNECCHLHRVSPWPVQNIL